MKKLCVMLPVAILALASFTLAADFSGTWVLDTAKSDPMTGRGGQAQGPMNMTLMIAQSGNALTITRKMNRGGQERSFDARYTLDGKETTGQGMGRAETVAKAAMQGETLVVQGTQKTPRGEFPFKEEYTLSDGGKVLTINATRGERRQKQVFNKQ